MNARGLDVDVRVPVPSGFVGILVRGALEAALGVVRPFLRSPVSIEGDTTVIPVRLPEGAGVEVPLMPRIAVGLACRDGDLELTVPNAIGVMLRPVLAGIARDDRVFKDPVTNALVHGFQIPPRPGTGFAIPVPAIGSTAEIGVRFP